MEDVDRPTHVQPLPEPAGARCSRVNAKTSRIVTSPERPDWIPRHRSRQRHLRQRAAIGPPEPQRPVRPARDLKPLLVDSAMMPAA
jgi:hypothetical protein